MSYKRWWKNNNSHSYQHVFLWQFDTIQPVHCQSATKSTKIKFHFTHSVLFFHHLAYLGHFFKSYLRDISLRKYFCCMKKAELSIVCPLYILSRKFNCSPLIFHCISKTPFNSNECYSLVHRPTPVETAKRTNALNCFLTITSNTSFWSMMGREKWHSSWIFHVTHITLSMSSIKILY